MNTFNISKEFGLDQVSFIAIKKQKHDLNNSPSPKIAPSGWASGG
jgi:hypothetical protein